jgi:hypothetical protein
MARVAYPACVAHAFIDHPDQGEHMTMSEFRRTAAPVNATRGLALALGAWLAACGSGTPGAEILAPSALTYSSNPAVYTTGSAITRNTPSSGGGAVASYSVSPPLPAGLSLNTSTGAITGTPTAATAMATYTITATNSAGHTTVGLVITVNAAISPVSLNTTTATVDPSEQRIFTASVTGLTDTSVTWSVSPPGSGSLSVLDASSVLYTAPSAPGQVQVTATSVENPNASATVTITVRAQAASTEVIFNNGNVGAVSNGPSAPTTFTIAAARHIVYINTYHYFNGGTLPGLLSLRHGDGTVYGPWQTTGTPGQGGVSNAYWVGYPDVTIKAGTYTVVDSDPSTWSCNSGSGGAGFAYVMALTLP